MSDTGARPSSVADAVPVTDRFRAMQLVRAAGIGLVLLSAAATPDLLVPGRRQAVTATLLYAVAVALAAVLARVIPGSVRPVFGGLLILDGIWLVWAGYLTGGLDSPLHYLILLHLGAVALIASYRSGLKIALWDSLLLYAVFSGTQSGALPGTDVERGFSLEGQRLIVFVAVLWLVAVSTSALSSVNERELRRRRIDLEALTTLAEQLEGASGSADVARTLLHASIQHFSFERGVVLGGRDGRLDVLASQGAVEACVLSTGHGRSELVTRAHRDRQTLLVRALDAPSDPWLSRLLPAARDLVVVPLSAEGRLIGALVLVQASSRSGRGSAVSGRLPRRVVFGLERSASYAALALRNAWLLEQVQQLAATDGLTQIANRRTFEASLEQEVARSLRSGEQLSLVMLDIDHFKRLNDERGHQAGDEVLRDVAAALSRACRDVDTAARYGGEEFAVVLPGCDAGTAAVIAERLRQAVNSISVGVQVTASAGVASFPRHADGADALVRAADEALYASKRNGRDRTTVSQGGTPDVDAEALVHRAVLQREQRVVDGTARVITLTD